MSELSSDELFQVNDIGDRFESLWRHGRGPRIEDFLAEQPSRLREVLLQHLIGIELELLRRGARPPSQESYESRFAEDHDAVRAAFAEDREAHPHAG